MSAHILQRATEIFKCPSVPKAPKHSETVIKSTHASLQVHDSSGSPSSDNIQVLVFDGSNCSRVMINLRPPDTILKLKQEYLKMRPELSEKLNLAYNGKPVSEKSTLADLGVKNSATFITFQKCNGG